MVVAKSRAKALRTRTLRRQMGRSFSVILTEETVWSVYSVYTVRAASTPVRDGKKRMLSSDFAAAIGLDFASSGGDFDQGKIVSLTTSNVSTTGSIRRHC